MSHEIKEQSTATVTVSDTIANPAPLGLLGFGLTTILLNLHNAGLFANNVMILAMGICYGGLAQLIAGIMEFKKGNTFGATAFVSYGCFWWSLVIIWFNPFAENISAAPSIAMGFYLLLWGIFTLFMFIGTLKHGRASQVVFFSLTVLFMLLALANFTGSHIIHVIAGVVGIFCGASAVYNAVGQILNETYGKTIFPL